MIIPSKWVDSHRFTESGSGEICVEFKYKLFKQKLNLLRKISGYNNAVSLWQKTAKVKSPVW